MPHFQCPRHYVCSTALGVALYPPAAWMKLPAGNEGPCTLSFARRTLSHLQYDVRLIIKLVELGNTTNDRALAEEYANSFVRAYHATHATLSGATYGGAPAVVIRGLPPTPGPTVYVVVSHTATVYLFFAPGKALGANQRQALAGLRFLARRGVRCS